MSNNDNDNGDNGNKPTSGFSAQSFRLQLPRRATVGGRPELDPVLIRRLSRLAAEAAEGKVSGFAMVSIDNAGGVRLTWSGTGTRELQIVGGLKALENVILQSVKTIIEKE